MLLGIAPIAASADSSEELIAAASALFDAKRYKDAAPKLEVFLSSYATDPKAGKAALVLGRCYSELQQYPKAVTAYEKAIASKDASVLLAARLGLGEAAVASEQFAKAPAPLEAAALAEPELHPVDLVLDHRRRVDRKLADRAERQPPAAGLVARKRRLIYKKGFRARAREVNRGRRAGRPGADHGDVEALHPMIVVRRDTFSSW